MATAPLDTAVNVAFPAITAGFGIEVAGIQWVIITYTLTYASLVLGLGRLGDIVGHRRVFVAGLLWSAAALSLCALATGYGWLLAARALQGVGSALVLSCAPALATQSAAESARARVLGLYTFAFALAYASGPLIGGVVVSRWGWPAVFWFRVPIALAAMALAFAFIPPRAARASGQRFDLAGAAAFVLGLASALIALNRAANLGWSAPLVLALAAVSALALSWFVRHLGRVDDPVIDPGHLRNVPFLAVNAANALLNLAGFFVMLLVPYYLSLSRGLSFRESGTLLALFPVGMTVAAPIAGRLIGRVSPVRLGAGGALLIAAALLGVSTWGADATPARIALTLFAQGFGLGLFQVCYTESVMATLPPQQHGVAGSLTMMTRTIGVVAGATGGSLLFAALGGSRDASAEAFVAAFRGSFQVAALVALAGFALALRRGR